MATPAGSYEIKWVRSVAETPIELWSLCFPPDVEGRWWYETLETCGLEDQFEFFYGVIFAGRQAVGVAPAFVMDVPIQIVAPDGLLPVLDLVGRFFPALLHQRTLFVGSPCGDEGTVGLAPGQDRLEVYRQVNRSVQALADRLGAPMRVWKDFAGDCGDDLALLAEEQGLFPMVSFPGAIVSFPEATKDSYFGRLKSSRRNKLKKKLNASAAAPIDVTVVESPPAAVLDEIFQLFWRTYEKGQTKFERLNRKFFEIVARHPQSSFIVIREKPGGSMVAFMLCFALGHRVINKFIGINYDTPKDWFLYFRLWDAVVDFAVAKGATSIQSGQTGYSAKIEIGHELAPLTNYVRHRNRLVHRIYETVARGVNWDTLDEDLATYLKAYPDRRPAIRRRPPAASGVP